MKIVRDPDIIRAALLLYPFEPISMDTEVWVADPDNIALTDARGNIGMFEHEFGHTGIYTGHYFFKDRGKYAKELSVRMLAEMFDTRAEIIKGLTPVKHKPAIWMTRRLGFKDYGTVDTWIGPCVIFIMTKAEFKEKYR